jgi:hypothetical protein
VHKYDDGNQRQGENTYGRADMTKKKNVSANATSAIAIGGLIEKPNRPGRCAVMGAPDKN